jgi:hypothetical protein
MWTAGLQNNPNAIVTQVQSAQIEVHIEQPNAAKVSMDISKLFIEDWLASKDCVKLTKFAMDMLQRDKLDPCDIECINNQIPDEYQYEFWEAIFVNFQSS